MMRIRSSSTMATMVSDLDNYRSAKLPVDQHGEDAATEAAMQADRLLAAGDKDGQRAWVRLRLELVMPPSLLCGIGGRLSSGTATRSSSCRRFPTRLAIDVPGA